MYKIIHTNIIHTSPLTPSQYSAASHSPVADRQTSLLLFGKQFSQHAPDLHLAQNFNRHVSGLQHGSTSLQFYKKKQSHNNNNNNNHNNNHH